MENLKSYNDDELIVLALAAYDEINRRQNVLHLICDELMRRLDARGATEIPHPQAEVKMVRPRRLSIKRKKDGTLP